MATESKKLQTISYMEHGYRVLTFPGMTSEKEVREALGHDARIAHQQREVMERQQEALKKALVLWDRHFSRALLKVMREPERVSYYALETEIHAVRDAAAPFLED